MYLVEGKYLLLTSVCETLMYGFQSRRPTVNTQTVYGNFGFYRVGEFHNHVNNFTVLNRDQASGS